MNITKKLILLSLIMSGATYAMEDVVGNIEVPNTEIEKVAEGIATASRWSNIAAKLGNVISTGLNAAKSVQGLPGAAWENLPSWEQTKGATLGKLPTLPTWQQIKNAPAAAWGKVPALPSWEQTKGAVAGAAGTVSQWAGAHPRITAGITTAVAVGTAGTVAYKTHAYIKETIQRASSLNKKAEDIETALLTGLVQEGFTDKDFVLEAKKFYSTDIAGKEKPLSAIAKKIEDLIFELENAQSVLLFYWQNNALKGNAAALTVALKYLMDTDAYKAELGIATEQAAPVAEQPAAVLPAAEKTHTEQRAAREAKREEDIVARDRAARQAKRAEEIAAKRGLKIK